MKKLLFFLVFTGFCASLLAQKRQLTLEDAVLYYKKGLLAKNLSGFNWAKQTDAYTTMDKDNKVITFHHPFTQEPQTTLTVTQVKSGLESFPYLNWIVGDHFYFL